MRARFRVDFTRRETASLRHRERDLDRADRGRCRASAPRRSDEVPRRGDADSGGPVLAGRPMDRLRISRIRQFGRVRPAESRHRRQMADLEWRRAISDLVEKRARAPLSRSGSSDSSGRVHRRRLFLFSGQTPGLVGDACGRPRCKQRLRPGAGRQTMRGDSERGSSGRIEPV